MTALGLGDIAAFPFVEPPDHRQVKDGVALLEELGALDTTADRSGAPAHPVGQEAGPAARRPAAGTDGAGRRRATAACPTSSSSRRRCRSRTLASGRPTTSRRPTRSTVASSTTAPTSSPTGTCGSTCASSRRTCPAAPSAGCAGRSSCTTCGSASGRTWSASSGRSAVRSAWTRAVSCRHLATTRGRCTSRCCQACCRTSGCGTPRSASTPVRAGPASHRGRGRRCSGSRRAG